MDEQFKSQIINPISPLVTVAMPVYNAGKFLRLAVLSIVKQTFTNWELLIIDDGSTDNAIDSIADIRDGRIRLLRDGANKGLAARLNEAIDLANGQFFARMDADDVSYPQRFERQVQALQCQHGLDLVSVQTITISGNNQLTGLLPYHTSNEAISSKPWRGFYLPHPTWMGKITWFRKYRYANPAPYFCEDQELLLRSYSDSQFLMILEPLFAYRIRDTIDSRKLIKTRLTVMHVQLKHFLTKRQMHFAFMAVATFFGRTLLDLLKGVYSISYPVVRIRNDKILAQWQDVLSFVENGIVK
jgi:glycosyltransferase involved in cell wall biosynthesis